MKQESPDSMRLKISTSTVGHWLFAGGCGLTLMVAVWVRFLPVGEAEYPVVFRSDSSFHLRMLSYMMTDGALPDEDPLFYRHPPRELAHVYPPNLYILTAAILQTAQMLKSGPVDFNWLLMFFNCLYGVLPVIGCGWLIWEVSGGKRVETIGGMLLCSIASPMVLRSHAGIFRHETVAVGLLLFFAGIIFHKVRRKGGAFWNWMAAICMFVGVGFWRLFPFLAAMIILGTLAAEFLRGERYHLGSFLGACALGCLAAAAGYSFYRDDLPATTLYFLPVLAMPLLNWLVHIPLVSSWRRSLLARKRGLLAAMIAIVLAGTLVVPVIRVRWQAVFSSAPLPLTRDTLYGILVEELAPLPLSEAFSSDFFLYLPILLLIAFLVLRGRWQPGAPYRIAVTLLLIFMTMTVCFVRFVFLAFPLLIVCLMPPLSGIIEELKITRPNLFGRTNLAILVALILLPALGFYLREDFRLAKYLLAPDRDLVAAYGWLKANVPSGENVISNWSHGYEIQTFTGRRTVMDGYLEDPQNQARILDLLRALLSTNEADLIRYMKMHRGKYLMLDRVYLFPACKRLHLPWPEWFEIQSFEGYSRLSLKPAADRNNYLKCLFDPGKLKHLQAVFNSGNYVVLQLKPTD